MKSKCGMDEKQCHDSTTQNTMNIPQPRIILHIRITIRGQVLGKGRVSIDWSMIVVTSKSEGRRVCTVKSVRPMNPVTACGLEIRWNQKLRYYQQLPFGRSL